MGRLIVSLLFFTVFLASEVESGFWSTAYTAWSRSLDSKDTAKLCLVRQAPIRIFFGLVFEYSRRSIDPLVVRQQISPVEAQSRDLYQSLMEVSTWRHSLQITYNFLKTTNEQLQQIVINNPGNWDPEFPRLTGIWSQNIKDRIKEGYEDLETCYAMTIPCAWMDFSCHVQWYLGNEASATEST